MKRGVIWACWLHAAGVLTILLFNAVGPERWWPFAVNMFLPQSVWALPSVALLPLTFWKARRWSWLPLATSLCVAGPLMGFTWSIQPAADGHPIRVMTYNVESWNRLAVSEVVREIGEHDPAILCLQDARGVLESDIGSLLDGWNVAVQGQYVIATRFPIIDPKALRSQARRRQPYFTARVLISGAPVTVVNAHLITPRAALMAASAVLTDPNDQRFWTRDVPVINSNLSRRLNDAESLAESVRAAQGPVIVAGDLNAPPQSLVSRRLLGTGLTDAFASSGRGYGYTFGHEELFGYSFVRIDRILVSRHFVPVRTRVGGNTGSDHRPVITDLVLTQTR